MGSGSTGALCNWAYHLIDLDMVAESNVNRQIHALGDAFGKAKTDAMARRILAINPSCRVSAIEDFVSQDNLAQMLDKGFDYVIDAIDNVRTKAAMIAWCKAHNTPIITSGGAGGQIDPTRIEITDLTRIYRTRIPGSSVLPKDAVFATQKRNSASLPFSSEPLRYPENGAACEEALTLTGLNCAGYGSSVCVTGPFGLFAAGEVLRHLAANDSSA